MENIIERDARYVLAVFAGWLRRRWCTPVLFLPGVLTAIIGRNTSRPELFPPCAILMVLAVVVADPMGVVSLLAAPELRAVLIASLMAMAGAWWAPVELAAKCTVYAVALLAVLAACLFNRRWKQRHATMMSPTVVKAMHAIQFKNQIEPMIAWEQGGSLRVRTALRVENGCETPEKEFNTFYQIAYVLGYLDALLIHERKDAEVERAKARAEQADERVGVLEIALEEAERMVEELSTDLQAAEEKNVELASQNADLVKWEGLDHKILRLSEGGMSQREIAEACGCSLGKVNKVIQQGKG